MIDDPSQLVISEGLKAAGTNTPLGISSLGELKHIENYVFRMYKMHIHLCLMKIAFRFLFVEMFWKRKYSLMLKIFHLRSRSQKFASYYVVSNDDEKQKKYMYKNISQSYLMMVWFTNISLLDTKYYALRLANAVLGQYSSSLLFRKLEKKEVYVTLYILI